MQILAYKPKTPLILVAGFLGSGKTSLLKEILNHFGEKKRIAIVQNEFAQSSIDSLILNEVNAGFVMREINTGSIFCSCLFSQFKTVLKELSSNHAVDMVVVEASGIADPIAIAQLMEDKELELNYYLSRIVSVVDAPRFLGVLVNIVGVRHQVQVADVVIVNKRDLVDEKTLEAVINKVREINPVAMIASGSHSKFDISSILSGDLKSNIEKSNITGELTKCGDGGYISRCYKSAKLISRERLEEFLGSLDENTLRLKGFVTLDDGSCVIVQYVPNQLEIQPIKQTLGRCELISIGYEAPNYELLITKTK